MTAPTNYYHLRHSCGHAVYWSDASLAIIARTYPCPWCGAETGTTLTAAHLPVMKFRYSNEYPTIYCVNSIAADGTFPGNDASIESTTVIVHHKHELCGCPD